MNALSIIIAGALIAAAILFVGYEQRYMVSGDGKAALRIDTRTGDVSYCNPVSFDEAPICTPFGAQTRGAYQESRAAAAEKERLAKTSQISGDVGTGAVDPLFTEALEEAVKRLLERKAAQQ